MTHSPPAIKDQQNNPDQPSSGTGDKPDNIDLWDWLISIPFLLAFFLTLVIYDLIQRIALLFGKQAHEYAVHSLNRTLVRLLPLTGASVEIEHLGEIPNDRPLIAISNHQSLYDIPILHTIFEKRRPKFISKKELAHWIPSVSFNLRHGGNAIIDRSNSRQAIGAIERLAEKMRNENFAVVIFPEGTRARDGKLKKFRYAGFATLLQWAPNAVIIPVTVDGSWHLAIKNFVPIPRNVRIRVVCGSPIVRREHESLKELNEEIYAIIENTLHRLRSPIS